MAPRSPLGTPEEVANYLRKSVGTMANWRCQGLGPAYIKDGDSKGVLYRWADVEDWIESKTIHPGRVPRAA